MTIAGFNLVPTVCWGSGYACCVDLHRSTYYHSHFTDEQTDAQLVRMRSWQALEVGFKSG